MNPVSAMPFAGSRRRALLAVLPATGALVVAAALAGIEAAVPVHAEALVHSAARALGSQATFNRTLSVNGRVELSVATELGNIHLTRGSGSQIHISGQVKARPGGSEERVREIAANPPIEQTGKIVRIGTRDENLYNISIDYEIEAPADARLDADTGSGNITDEGVGENTKLSAGSGAIKATGLHGGFSVNTGSGDIYVEQTGQGDGKATTGSGTVELKGLQGALRAGAGSGDVKVSGMPAKDWKIETGSGDVEIWVGSAPLRLDASTGSGGHSHRPRGADARDERPPPSDRHAKRGRRNGEGRDRLGQHPPSMKAMPAFAARLSRTILARHAHERAPRNNPALVLFDCPCGSGVVVARKIWPLT
jgi:hypothetical protein